MAKLARVAPAWSTLTFDTVAAPSGETVRKPAPPVSVIVRFTATAVDTRGRHAAPTRHLHHPRVAFAELAGACEAGAVPAVDQAGGRGRRHVPTGPRRGGRREVPEDVDDEVGALLLVDADPSSVADGHDHEAGQDLAGGDHVEVGRRTDGGLAGREGLDIAGPRRVHDGEVHDDGADARRYAEHAGDPDGHRGVVGHHPFDRRLATEAGVDESGGPEGDEPGGRTGRGLRRGRHQDKGASQGDSHEDGTEPGDARLPPPIRLHHETSSERRADRDSSKRSAW